MTSASACDCNASAMLPQSSRRPIAALRTASLLFLSAYFLSAIMMADALIAAPRHMKHHFTRQRHYYLSPTQLYVFNKKKKPKHSPLEDEPWKKDDSYWDQLQEASKDPVLFEKFIEKSRRRRLEKEPTHASTFPSSSSSTAVKSNGVDAAEANGDEAPKKKSKYVPIEEWDEQRKNGENMSKEERVQWECQRMGDQFRQNEILRQNLKSF